MRVWTIQSTQHWLKRVEKNVHGSPRGIWFVREHRSWEVQIIIKSFPGSLGMDSIVVFAFTKRFTITFSQLLRNLIQVDVNERSI